MELGLGTSLCGWAWPGQEHGVTLVCVWCNDMVNLYSPYTKTCKCVCARMHFLTAHSAYPSKLTMPGLRPKSYTDYGRLACGRRGQCPVLRVSPHKAVHHWQTCTKCNAHPSKSPSQGVILCPRFPNTHYVSHAILQDLILVILQCSICVYTIDDVLHTKKHNQRNIYI